jgi:nucleoside phosphorylase
MSNPEDYSVGWICAVPIESAAAQVFLQERHPPLNHKLIHDNNCYELGKIGGHNVVIAILPDGEYGTNSAAVAATHMLRTFPNIKISLMVGIGGGAPSPKIDIRLGDIVVSSPSNGRGGVLQYDFGKTIQTRKFQSTGILDQPSKILRTAVNGLKAYYGSNRHRLTEEIDSAIANNTSLARRFAKPHLSKDRLYKSNVIHVDGTTCSEACGDDTSRLVARTPQTENDDDPAIHYGLIASANQLMKDAKIRDMLVKDENVLCFEMEAARMMNDLHCLVIRGICRNLVRDNDDH